MLAIRDNALISVLVEDSHLWRTQHRCQDYQPSPDVRECLYNLSFLQSLIFGSSLVVSDSLYCNYALFLCEHMCMNRGVRHPDQHAYAHENGQGAKEKA